LLTINVTPAEAGRLQELLVASQKDDASTGTASARSKRQLVANELVAPSSNTVKHHRIDLLYWPTHSECLSCICYQSHAPNISSSDDFWIDLYLQECFVRRSKRLAGLPGLSLRVSACRRGQRIDLSPIRVISRSRLVPERQHVAVIDAGL
jgi:hypothetical protein